MAAILVVDENKDHWPSIGHVLKSLGHHYNSVASRDEALQRLRSGKHWDAILIEVDGTFNALHKAMKNEDPQVPMIGMSEGDRSVLVRHYAETQPPVVGFVMHRDMEMQLNDLIDKALKLQGPQNNPPQDRQDRWSRR